MPPLCKIIGPRGWGLGGHPSNSLASCDLMRTKRLLAVLIMTNSMLLHKNKTDCKIHYKYNVILQVILDNNLSLKEYLDTRE
jgi:hypothetical protein